MGHLARRALRALLLVLTTVAPGPTEARQDRDLRMLADGRTLIQRSAPASASTGARPFARTELYFGTARANGVVSEAEFRDFVDQHVTPEFPDGFTLIKGDGQFIGDDNTVAKEQSFVLILLYPYDRADTSSKRIERIRTVYREQFDQKSVLRVDDSFVVWVSFQRPAGSMWRKRLTDGAALAGAEIPVERIDGPVLMFSGKDDQIWPSDIFAARVVERLEAHRFTHRVEHYTYENAGHQITRPFVPTGDVRQLRIHPVSQHPNMSGGTPDGQARANEDSWQKLLAFVDKYLRN